MAPQYRVDDGGAVAFRNTPAMNDRSDVRAKPGDSIVAEARHGEGKDEWVRHTNGLWLPVQFLTVDDGADVVQRTESVQTAVNSATGKGAQDTGPAAGSTPGIGANADLAEPTAVEDAKTAQRERLERLPGAQLRPSGGLKLELNPGAPLPSEPHLKYLRLGGKVADSLRRSDKKKAECATDLDANEKLLALATERGAIHVLDLSGGSIRRFDAHAMAVHAIHIDQDGEHIASCSRVR